MISNNTNTVDLNTNELLYNVTSLFTFYHSSKSYLTDTCSPFSNASIL